MGNISSYLFILFLSSTSCYAQWEAELMVGASGYEGDLIKSRIAIRTLRPAATFNLKYNIENSFIIRAGLAWCKVMGDDKFNQQPELKARNLNFQSNILEASLCVELNLLELEIFYAYPYIFGGIGLFHFDPFTHDKDDKKTYLQPLSTEGQGLPDYLSEKPYSRTQFCLPFGAGWKVKLNKKWTIAYEIGYRVLFTDYLDDVSSTYVDPQILEAAKGPKAVELSYRALQTPGSYPIPGGDGDQRGNSKKNDSYFLSGIKLLLNFGQQNGQVSKK